MSVDPTLRQRLTRDLEPVLALPDPRPRISAYHDMPYAIFRYDPQDEFELRREITMLSTRLETHGKRVTRISLADCLRDAMESQYPLADWFNVEREMGTRSVVDTVHTVLDDYTPLVDLVAARLPPEQDPLRDVVFIARTGTLFPMYRTFSLLEQLQGRIVVPAVLFYPGVLDGAAGLKFMTVLDAEHNYRPKIY